MKTRLLFAPLALLLFAACATGSGAPPAPEDAMSLDDALAAVVRAVEAEFTEGTEIAVYEISSPDSGIEDFFLEELSGAFSAGGKFILLARKDALTALDSEHQFQMSGLVDDESAVGIGHYLGAEVLITGTFSRYANFSRLYIRAVNVLSSVTVSYTARIDNSDPILAGVMSPLGNATLPAVTETALALLDSGKDLYAAGKLDEALGKFTAAIAVDKNLAEAYFYRGLMYYYKGDNDRAIADYTEAIRINPKDDNAYSNRGDMHNKKRNYDQAIADCNTALRINPNNFFAYNNRGVAYFYKGDYDRAIADYNTTLRIEPNYGLAYSNRGLVYDKKGDRNRAIADYTEALRIDPNGFEAYVNRGVLYGNDGSIDRAIADFNTALRINPSIFEAYVSRGILYSDKGDYDRAIADFEAALRIDPNNPINANVKEELDYARQQRGR